MQGKEARKGNEDAQIRIEKHPMSGETLISQTRCWIWS